MGLNHILKLCWFTRFEIASSIDKSKSACMLGPVMAGPVADLPGIRARNEAQIPDSRADPWGSDPNTSPGPRKHKKLFLFKSRSLKIERSRSGRRTLTHRSGKTQR